MVEGRLLLSSGELPFQIILSAMQGATQNEEQVRDLDEHAVGRLPVVSPLRRLDAPPEYQLYTVTRKTPHGEILLRYYAGKDGLVLLTLETLAPLDATTRKEYEEVLRCLVLEFEFAKT